MNNPTTSELEIISWRSLVLAILALALGSLLPDTAVWHVLAEVIRDIGIAVLVGIYLMWTLERINAQRREAELAQYVQTVGDNFTKAVYGRALPAELFEVVKQSIFQQSFIRTAYTADWRLHNFNETFIAAAPEKLRALLEEFRKELDGESSKFADLIVIRFSVSYEIKNVDAVARQYPVRWQLPRPFGGNYPGLCGITSVLINREQRLKGVYANTTDGDQSDSTNLSYSTDVTIAPGATMRTDIEAYSVRSKDDKEQWQTLIPCKGMSIRVTDADGDKDVFIELDAPLLRGEESFSRKDPNTNAASMTVEQFLLPYQGVTVTWTPTPPAKVEASE